MPKKLGGYSDLGRQINDINSGTDFVKSRITPEPKIGIIHKAIKIKGDHKYEVILKLKDNTTGKAYLSSALPLIDHPSFISSNFGGPQDLEGKFFCQINYTGPSSGRGAARIIRSIVEDGGEANKWAELPIEGHSFAVV